MEKWIWPLGGLSRSSAINFFWEKNKKLEKQISSDLYDTLIAQHQKVNFTFYQTSYSWTVHL